MSDKVGVKSANFALLGEQSIASDFGKKGTSSDLTLYDKKESGIIRTGVAPSGFPEKIQPLLQAINLVEYVIFYIGSLDRYAGEQMVALDILGKKEGILSHSYEVDESRLNAMIRGTVLERYRRVPPEEMSAALAKFEPIQTKGSPRVAIDHAFDVKGVGTVVLGKVFAGTIRQYDKMLLLPHKKEVLVKSIQMHDDDVKEASSPARVGLSLKGAKPEDIGRGDVLCAEEIPTASQIELAFNPCPFYDGVPSINQGCMASVGLQMRAAKFTSTDPVRLSLDRPIAYRSGDICVVLKPESAGIRIMGHGRIK